MDASCGQFQEIPSHSLENVLACTKTQQDRKPKPQPEQALPCPRCESTNTKFCYYNNYSLSQPRYFCKSCRRYWTKGGTLRNVPVGGGCRKNKRSSSSSYKRTQEQSFGNNPSNTLAGYQTLGGYDSNDLALAFARLQQKQCHGQQQLGYHEDHDMSIIRHQNNTQCDIIANHSNVHNGNSGFLDALRSGYLENQNDYHNLYSYGVGNGVNNIGDVDNSGSLEVSTEMVMPFQEEISTIAATTAVTVTTMKQEMCNVARESENRGVLWGFPWQFNGDGNMSDVAASSWHGLINSPLM